LVAAPAASHPGVSRSRRSGDANLALGARTDAMQRQGVPRHGVAEREVAREDAKERVPSHSRILQEGQRGGVNGKGSNGED
jgi:hypothetical protein